MVEDGHGGGCSVRCSKECGAGSVGDAEGLHGVGCASGWGDDVGVLIIVVGEDCVVVG